MGNTDPLKKQLLEGCDALGLSLNAAQTTNYLDYLQLLQQWNRTYNLTAIKAPDLCVSHHLLDSLSIAPLINQLLEGKHIQPPAQLLDIGTGAGFPGLALAIYYPQHHFVLLDSRRKKTAFLSHVISQLRINNAHVVCSRIEDYKPEYAFDIILARAFAHLRVILQLSRPLCQTGSRIIAMKGHYPHDELDNIKEPAVTHKLSVPGLEDKQRHAVIIEPKIEGVR